MSNLAKPSFADIMELIPQIMSNMDGVKIKNLQPEDIDFFADTKTWYVTIQAKDDATVEKINKLLPTLLGLLSKDEEQ